MIFIPGPLAGPSILISVEESNTKVEESNTKWPVEQLEFNMACNKYGSQSATSENRCRVQHGYSDQSRNQSNISNTAKN